MPWPPGLTPVANVDQATGVCAGRVVATREYPPCSLSRARLGSWPASSSRETIVGLRPSRQMTMTFLMAPSTGSILDWGFVGQASQPDADRVGSESGKNA